MSALEVPLPRLGDDVTDQNDVSDKRSRPLERATRIIEVLASHGNPLGVSEVARLADMPKSTAHRMLAELASAGVVTHGGGRYGVGPRLVSLADTVTMRTAGSLRRLILPHLVELRDQTGLGVAFAVLRHGRVLFLDALYGRAMNDTLGPLAYWAPVHASCCGKALLAAGRIPIPTEPLRGYTPATITDPAHLKAELRQIRREGVAYDHGEYVEGITGAACVVYRGPQPVGALALCGRTGEFDLAKATIQLRQAVTNASAALRRHE